MRKAIINILIGSIIMIGLVMVAGCKIKGETASGLITIKAIYQIEEWPPTTNYSGITVMITGADSTTLTTGPSGNISISLQVSNYTIAAGKTGYDPVTRNITASVEGTTYDLGKIAIRRAAAPGSPY